MSFAQRRSKYFSFVHTSDEVAGPVAGDLNTSQAGDSLSAAAVIAITAALAANQAADTLSAAATIAVTAALGKTQDDQTLSATGSSISGSNGSLDLSQAANTLSATALVAVTAALSISQGADTLTADATITGSGPVTADLTITQNDQVLLGSASGPSSSSGAGSSSGTGQQRRRRHKKYIVEIDGEQFSVANVAEAQELLAEAQSVAEQKAQQELDKALESRMRPNKLRRVIVHKLQTPEIRIPDSEIDPIASQIEVQAQEFRKRVSELYADIVRSAEIGVLLRRQQDEEDDFIISLFL